MHEATMSERLEDEINLMFLHGSSERPLDINLLHEGLVDFNELDISGLGLSALPESAISPIPKSLFLANNRLSHLPDAIERMVGLVGIHMAYNRCHIVPRVLSRMRHLRIVDLRHNKWVSRDTEILNIRDAMKAPVIDDLFDGSLSIMNRALDGPWTACRVMI